MIEFNPLFAFSVEEKATPLTNESLAPSDLLSSNIRKVDDIIRHYREEKTKDIFDIDEEELELEETCLGSTCKITDSLREKSKAKKRKKIPIEESENEPDPQYEFSQSVDKYIDVDSFLSFKLSKPLLKALTEMAVFKPTAIQCACIPVTLMNRDICACARTGSGKTLAFLLPLLERLIYTPSSQRNGTKALVISPTRELAVQIFKVAENLVKYCPKIRIQLAAGGLDLSSQEASLRKNPEIVVATPGRLIDHLSNAPNFTLHGIEYLVLDEADKLLDEYFTEQVGEIVRHCSSQRQTLLFSATMTESVKELATVSLKNPVRVFLNQSTAVANRLNQEFVRIRPQREKDRDAMLVALLVRSFSKRTLVFLPTKKDCHRMHILLGLMGLHCAELHGDMNQAQRLEALRRFTDVAIDISTTFAESRPQKTDAGGTPNVDSPPPPVDILLATDLAARGLDIPNILTVINYRLPPTMKQYVHRVGRTARASHSGRAVSIAGEFDRKLLKEIVKDAPCPIKARIIPPEVIARFKARIAKMQPFLEEILLMETEEKELEAAQSQLAKVERMAAERALAKHSKHGAAPLPINPKRTNWFSEKRDALRLANKGSVKNKRGSKMVSKKFGKGNKRP